MLYNPEWKKSLLAGFIAWIEMQDPETSYDYCDPLTCVFAKYLESLGRATVCDLSRLFPEADAIALGDVLELHGREWTYGEALKRAKKCMMGEVDDA